MVPLQLQLWFLSFEHSQRSVLPGEFGFWYVSTGAHFDDHAVQNKTLSDSQDPILSLQGVPYAIRQVAKIARMELDIAVTPLTMGFIGNCQPANLRISMTSSLTGLGFIGTAPLRAVGIPTKKTKVRTLDGSELTQEEPVVGRFLGKMWICSIVQLESEDVDEYLKEGWDGDKDDNSVIRWSVKSLKLENQEPWFSEQAWGIQGMRYTGRVKMSNGAGAAAYAKLVYDYQW
ncbi:hypothetical protein JX266_007706 [Neoarthrinium moseri]|nr:hypothetical protein JX266_007706 [Neoarthrinium moseri]